MLVKKHYITQRGLPRGCSLNWKRSPRGHWKIDEYKDIKMQNWRNQKMASIFEIERRKKFAEEFPKFFEDLKAEITI